MDGFKKSFSSCMTGRKYALKGVLSDRRVHPFSNWKVSKM